MITSNGENKKSLIENLSRTRMKVQKKKTENDFVESVTSDRTSKSKSR